MRRPGAGGFVEQAEQAGLALGRVLLRFLRALHGLIDGGQELAALPSESSAPALMSDSITRLFITRRSTFSQNSQKLAKRPPSSSRALRMESMALPPTFFTAARPKRMASPSGVTVRRELRAGDLHVGRLDADAHLAALADVLHHVVGL